MICDSVEVGEYRTRHARRRAPGSRPRQRRSGNRVRGPRGDMPIATRGLDAGALLTGCSIERSSAAPEEPRVKTTSTFQAAGTGPRAGPARGNASRGAARRPRTSRSDLDERVGPRPPFDPRRGVDPHVRVPEHLRQREPDLARPIADRAVREDGPVGLDRSPGGDPPKRRSAGASSRTRSTGSWIAPGIRPGRPAPSPAPDGQKRPPSNSARERTSTIRASGSSARAATSSRDTGVARSNSRTGYELGVTTAALVLHGRPAARHRSRPASMSTPR